jgi:hypothetical protein
MALLFTEGLYFQPLATIPYTKSHDYTKIIKKSIV